MWKARPVRRGTIINLVKTATSTLAFLANNAENGRDVPAPKRLKKVQFSLQFAGYRLFPCDMDMNIVKSEFIRAGVVATFDDYDLQNGTIMLNNATSELLQRVYAEHFSSLWEAKRISATLVKEGGKAF